MTGMPNLILPYHVSRVIEFLIALILIIGYPMTLIVGTAEAILWPMAHAALCITIVVVTTSVCLSNCTDEWIESPVAHIVRGCAY